MIKEILFVHHSHTDIGYTHPQPVVMELHRRFIDEALDIAERTADYPDDSRFRWTCEVTGITLDWWKNASNADRDRFLAAVKRGQFEVAGLAWHMTPLMDHGMVVDVLRPLSFFRDLGIPVRSAMNTDVNGLPWGVVDALLDHGITGISMAINEHFGHALRPWPRAFRWQAPGGRTITAYNGFIYGVTSDIGMKVPVSLDEALVKVPQWTRLWEDRGYPHDFLMMQITNIRYHDNGSPQAGLPDFIRRFNDASSEVKLRFVTLSEFFDRMRAEPEDRLPLMRGDWTDWWNFGAGSTAHETSQALRGQRDLDDAISLRAWRHDEPKRFERHLEDARQALALYAEHTWGADRSVWDLTSPETRTQQLLKLVQAPQGASLARMLRRDGLEALVAEAGGEEPRVLVYNPHPVAVRRSLRLPYLPPLAGASSPPPVLGLEEFVPHGPTSHRTQRLDVHLSDFRDERAYWSAPVEVPALSYVTLPAVELKPAEGDVEARDGKLSNGRISIELDRKRGGVKSLKLDGVEYAGQGPEDAVFGVPVLERPEAGTREAIFDRVKVDSPDWHEAWHNDWKAIRELPDGVEEETAVAERGRAEIAQRFALPNGDRVRVVYRLVPDEAALELEVEVAKTPIASPHSLYLPLPTPLSRSWNCDFETGGATVRLDDEQLPYASRHYITTQRWIRIADETHELMVACPDAPLWQVGGYTYGRFGDPDGRVRRTHPMLLAWLTNNYWQTNFQADQAGLLRFRFWLLPGAARPLGESIKAVLPYAHPPAVHLYAERGPVASAAASLLKLDIGQLVLTRLERNGTGVALTLLNPADDPQTATIGSGTFELKRAVRTSLAGEDLEPLSGDGSVELSVAPRAWVRVALYAD
jgi:alpha-mannosidase